MLLNPEDNDEPVYFDDCQREPGTVNEDGTINPPGSMIEAKSRYAENLAAKGIFGEQFRENVTEEWLDQASRQVEAAGDRQVVWYFEESEAQDFAHKLFQGNKRLEKIWLEHGYWAEGATWK